MLFSDTNMKISALSKTKLWGRLSFSVNFTISKMHYTYTAVCNAALILPRVSKFSAQLVLISDTKIKIIASFLSE